ncbi:hypothetical protein PHMEG_0003240 [Phytophthora megakarya]|uniref:Uncharacterized protein n=1 Tax=Phytophthora megakarya TaxID=4795 RepID=A0A225WYI8_9STRA|nr:hypothetical protein PHMEG_0003240 [Phytophthora megakarya]
MTQERRLKDQEAAHAPPQPPLPAQATSTPPPPQAPQPQVNQGVFQQQQALRYPNARQKKLTIRPFNRKEIYVGLDIGFLKWGRRFERQIFLAQTGSIDWDTICPELPKVEMWVAQMPKLQYVMERMLETIKTNVAPP